MREQGQLSDYGMGRTNELGITFPCQAEAMTVSPTSVHEAYYVMNNRSLSLGV
jgi:hypothetical protein